MECGKMKKTRETILLEFERIKQQMERLVTETLKCSSKDEEIYISNCKSLAINIRILLSDTNVTNDNLFKTYLEKQYMNLN